MKDTIKNVMNEKIKAIAVIVYKGHTITLSTQTNINSVAVWNNDDHGPVFMSDTIEEAIEWVRQTVTFAEKDAATLKDHKENLS